MIWNIDGDRVAMQVLAPDGTAEDVLKGRLVIDPGARPRTFAHRGGNRTRAAAAAGQPGDLRARWGCPEALPRDAGTAPPEGVQAGRGGSAHAHDAEARRPGGQGRRRLAPSPRDRASRSRSAAASSIPTADQCAAAKILFFRPDIAHAGRGAPGGRPRRAREVRATERSRRPVPIPGPGGRLHRDRSLVPRVAAESLGGGRRPRSRLGRLPSPSWTSGLTLKLAKDDIPIDGRVLDLEGRPVSDATVRVLACSRR